MTAISTSTFALPSVRSRISFTAAMRWDLSAFSSSAICSRILKQLMIFRSVNSLRIARCIRWRNLWTITGVRASLVPFGFRVSPFFIPPLPVGFLL